MSWLYFGFLLSLGVIAPNGAAEGKLAARHTQKKRDHLILGIRNTGPSSAHAHTKRRRQHSSMQPPSNAAIDSFISESGAHKNKHLAEI